MPEVYKDESMVIKEEQLGPWGTNAYTLACRATGESAIIDAPGDPEKMMQMAAGTTPRYILLTHNHPDHIGALAELKGWLKVPFCVHPGDAVGLPAPADVRLDDGMPLKLGNLNIEVIHTPGHTPGGCCFLVGKCLFGGDTVFPGGPGKTWSPVDFKQLVASITGRIYTLPGDTLILTGHGDSTTVAESRAEYEGFAARPHGDDICGDVLWASS